MTKIAGFLNKKRMNWLVVMTLSLSLLLGGVGTAYATAEKENYKWEKPMFVYGAGLGKGEIEKTKEVLGAKDTDVNSAVVNAQDMMTYIQGKTKDVNMISSVVVKKLEAGSGISVRISPETSITKITAAQYANAAITAGAEDVLIIVGAYRPVTGESALTGVYKAIDLNGEKIDTERSIVANEELITVNEIAKEHENQEGFSSEKLDQIVVTVKQQLQENKEKTGETATKDQIQQMIDEAVKKAGLQNIITNINITNMVNFFQNFQNTGAIDSKAVGDQLKKLGDDLTKHVGELGQSLGEKAGEVGTAIGDKAGEIGAALGEKAGEIGKAANDALNDLSNKAEESGIMGTIQGIIDAIVAFFRGIFDWIANFFGSLFGGGSSN